jgi:hypothetical protein
MKKITICIMTALILSGTIPTQAKATPSVPTSIEASAKISESAETESLVLRLNEIKEMDKKDLSSSEKRELRKEVLSIKSTLATQNNGGIYLSAGAIIIIVLLLIIIL